jgi:hypothetical protein
LPRSGQTVYKGSVHAWTAEHEEHTSAEETNMGYRQPFTAMLAIWGLLLAIEAFAQGVPAPAPGASPSLQEAVLLRSKTLFEYRVKSPQGEDLGKIEEVMIDMEMGRVAYAVLSFGGLWGLAANGCQCRGMRWHCDLMRRSSS